MKETLTGCAVAVVDSLRNLAPIFAVIGFFQIVILRQALPDLVDLIIGALLVALGMTLFVKGLKTALFPIGESLAYAFARKGSLFWLLLFAFGLGFGTTVAEPALIAIAGEAAKIAAVGGVIENVEEARAGYATGLRLAVALAVGFAIVLGVIRIIKGWPLPYLIVAGYGGVILLTPFAPREIIGLAYDSGGVTTSTITVPLVTALGVGLASSIKGRNPMADGFGLIAFASLTPIVFVMAFGILF